MNNASKYLFSDFTHEHYHLLLEKAKERFEFVTFDSATKKTSFVIWRHDVDFSMHEAVRLARIENKFEIKAIYFLLLHSEFYNLFESSITDKVREIISLGHEIGLHFDPGYYRVKTKSELEECLLLEKNLIEKIFGVKVQSFSFHNPERKILAFDDQCYSGMFNTYSKFLKENVIYCSDSNGYWRFRRLIDVILDPETQRLQALTHPEWWTEKVMSPKEKIWACIDGRALANKNLYLDKLKQFNRKIID